MHTTLRCNLKRVHRLMRILGLRSICRRKKRTRKEELAAEYLAENILDKRFTAFTTLKDIEGGLAV
ncbi:IS3 family transposase [Oscillospiraceae bacterium 38-13]